MSEQETEKKSQTAKSTAAPKASAGAPKRSTAGAKTQSKSGTQTKSSKSSGAGKTTAARSASSGTKTSATKTSTAKKTSSSSSANAPKSTRTAKPKAAVEVKAAEEASDSVVKSETAISASEKSAKPKTPRKPKVAKPETVEAPRATEPTVESEAPVDPVADVEAEIAENNTVGAAAEIAATEPAAHIEFAASEDIEKIAASASSDDKSAEPEPDGDQPLLRVKELKKYFLINNAFLKKNRKYLRAVDGVSFDLYAGKTIGIVGESGCGKTTMGRTILRLTDVTDGEVLFKGIDLAKLKGEPLRKLRPQFQMIFQDPYSSLSPRMPVGEIIGEAVKVHKIVPKEQYKDYIVDIMEKCGLQSHYFERYPHEFSGGQRQRICIAKVLALNPQLVICDEPVSALDVSIQAQIINLFKDLQSTHNLAYVFISHDLSVVEHISDDVGVMYLGNMVELAPKKELFAHPMHPYTEALLSAVPMPDPSVKMNRITLNGDIPSPANPPKGCKFHTRCTKCMDVCKEVEPKFKSYGNGHCVACHLYSQDD